MLGRIDHSRPRALAAALTSPSAVLLAGAAASAAILAGAPLFGAAAVGAAAWAVRVVTALPKTPAPTRIDARRLREPWRSFVRDALDARRRFEEAVAGTDAGPLRDRLAEVSVRIADGAQECWAIARRGDALERAGAQLQVDDARRQLSEVEAERRAFPRPELETTAAALHRQISSAARLQTVAGEARDRLRRLNAQLDEAVARAVELSLHADLAAVRPLGNDVEAMVGELESLRQALEETSSARPVSGTGG